MLERYVLVKLRSVSINIDGFQEIRVSKNLHNNVHSLPFMNISKYSKQ